MHKCRITWHIQGATLKDCHTREIQEMRLERVTRLLERPCRPSWVLTVS